MQIIIVGAGASGIFSGIYLKKYFPNYDIKIIEKSNTLGDRIKVSGNGRCNFFNRNVDKKFYNNQEFVKPIIEEFILNHQAIFDELGFEYFFDEEGRAYPYSLSSKTILYCLERKLKEYKVEVLLNEEVLDIKYEGQKVLIKTTNQEYHPDKVVLAIGGISLYNNESRFLSILNHLDLKVTELTPSLTPIKTSKFLKSLEGNRKKVLLKLEENDKTIFTEYGEVLFKKDGISGIVTFNASAYLARKHLKDYKNYKLVLDLLPEDRYNEKSLKELFKKKLKYNADMKELLNDFFTLPLCEEIYLRFKKTNKDTIDNLIYVIKNFKLDVIGLYDFKNSQVTSGGVDLNQIESNLKVKGKPIYVLGETLDIDGTCGGFNLTFAFATGFYLANHLLDK